MDFLTSYVIGTIIISLVFCIVAMPLHLLAIRMPFLTFIYPMLAGAWVGYQAFFQLNQCGSPCDAAHSLILEVSAGVMIVFLTLIAWIFKKPLHAFIAHGKETKLALSILLTAGISYMFIQYTQPCGGNPGSCSHAIGFPVPILTLSSEFSVHQVLTLFTGILCNIMVWFTLLTLLFGPFRNKRTTAPDKSIKPPSTEIPA